MNYLWYLYCYSIASSILSYSADIAVLIKSVGISKENPTGVNVQVEVLNSEEYPDADVDDDIMVFGKSEFEHLFADYLADGKYESIVGHRFNFEIDVNCINPDEPDSEDDLWFPETSFKSLAEI